MKKRAPLLFCLIAAILLFQTTCRSPTSPPPWPVAGIGDTVEVRFEVTEGLTANPEVRLGGRDMQLQSFDSGIYTYVYAVDGTEVEGLQSIEIDVEDLAGNEGSTQQEDAVQLDFNASRALVDGIITNLQVTPTLAGVEAEVTATFRSTAALLGNPTTTLGGNAMTFTSLVAGLYKYAYYVNGSEGDGYKDFEAQAQLQNGDTTVKLLEDAVYLDVTAPAAQSIEVTPSLARQGTAVKVCFRTTESCLSNPTVRLADILMAFTSLIAGTYEYTYVVLGTEAEGIKDVSIALLDGAGNPGSASQLAAVRFDFTPAAIYDFAASPLHARGGIQVVVSFRINEPCVGNPTISLGGSSMTFASMLAGKYTYTYQVSGAESEGAKDIEISTEDMAGNASVQQQPGAVWFDFTPPAATILEVTVR